MGRSKPAKPVKQQPEEPVPGEPVQVKNLYEAGALKQALDDAAREVVLDAGYDEDIVISNIKIGLGIAAIGSALISQFGPGKFPGNWWMVFTCVVAYLILTLLMNLYSWKVEGEAFLVTRPFRGSKGLRVSSRMARYSDEYVLAMADRADPTREVTRSVRIPDFFHADGYLAEAAWREVVEKLLGEAGQLQAKKND
ncbi:hypothetical protein GPECTOR_8g136 [Gonium pectorale]|uniref:Signal peptidase complex subunit 2 n=1 Tax=Gonium pectorale TaxID=33097 RepID=A0A150GSJ4_GONPE|nr:hypothetical protein GPECTOR_8g136 [Gonium pectorale]|eukprot:KXZ52744.1 hypothetical protein GPECTOR_8g136 [Gonium pectorale]